MLNKLFRQSAIPVEYHSNFLHLYFDIGWFGVLSGSAINFLTVYATRIGATGLQIGLIGAMSAVVTLFLAIPAGHWLQRRNIGQAMFWTSVLYRIGFLPFVFLPWLSTESAEITAIIAITFLMAIPLTPLGVGFPALFAEAVPDEYRAHVAGIRNVMLSVTFMATSLLSGYILDQVTFPIGYQIVFAMGFLGAAMSSFHLYFIRPIGRERTPPLLRAQPKPDPTPQAASPRNLAAILRLDILRTPFLPILLSLFSFHLAQNLATPIFPIFNVRELHLNDNHIGIGTALFYLTVLIGSTRLRKIVHRLGNKRVTGLGVVGLAIYPTLLAFSHQVWQFYAVSIIGGFFWALVSGSYANYMLEHIPPDDRPTHLAWYNIVLNIAILIGSLAGPAIADQIGLFSALILFGFLRFAAGIFILRWG
jgi:MFS family permease